MLARSWRTARLVVLVALAPLLAGAHCNEDCTKPRPRLVLRPIERTIYGTALLTMERVTPLAEGLEPFDKRALRVDASRPVVVVLASGASWAELKRADAARLKVGDGGEAYRVIAVMERAGKVALFEDARALAGAKRAGWDAVLLLPRDKSPEPWEAAVTVEIGRLTPQVNDPADGRCRDRDRIATELPSFRLASLPARCGDGVRQSDEDCDDGNREPGDGCSPYCTKER